MLAETWGWFTEEFDTKDFQAVKALHADLAWESKKTDHPLPFTPPISLTTLPVCLHFALSFCPTADFIFIFEKSESFL